MHTNTAPHNNRKSEYIDGPFLDLITKIVDRTNRQLSPSQPEVARRPFNATLTFSLGSKFANEFSQILKSVNA